MLMLYALLMPRRLCFDVSFLPPCLLMPLLDVMLMPLFVPLYATYFSSLLRFSDISLMLRAMLSFR